MNGCHKLLTRFLPVRDITPETILEGMQTRALLHARTVGRVFVRLPRILIIRIPCNECLVCGDGIDLGKRCTLELLGIAVLQMLNDTLHRLALIRLDRVNLVQHDEDAAALCTQIAQRIEISLRAGTVCTEHEDRGVGLLDLPPRNLLKILCNAVQSRAVDEHDTILEKSAREKEIHTLRRLRNSISVLSLTDCDILRQSINGEIWQHLCTTIAVVDNTRLSVRSLGCVL